MNLDLTQWMLVAFAATCAHIILTEVARAIRRRGATEFARQVLELIALATTRQVPVSPLLRRTAEHARRRDRGRLLAIADSLDSGQPLSSSLVTGAPGCFPPHVLASITAVEGGPALSRVLSDAAREHDSLDALRFRAKLTTGYPALLAVLLLVFTHYVAITQGEVAATLDGSRSHVDLGTAIAIVGSILAITLWWMCSARSERVSRLLSKAPWIGERLHMLATARWLRTIGGRLGDGAPLAVALRETAPAAGHARLERDVTAAADLAATGAPTAAIWQRTGIPEFVVAHMQSIRPGGGSLDVANKAKEVARRCMRIATDALVRVQRRVQLGTLLVFGLAIGLQWGSLFGWLARVRGAAEAQIPW